MIIPNFLVRALLHIYVSSPAPISITLSLGALSHYLKSHYIGFALLRSVIGPENWR